MRVAVPFGKTKIFTGLVYRIHHEDPSAYKAKEIHQILDDEPVVTIRQLDHWKWLKNETFQQEDILNDDEYLIYEALQHQSVLKIQEISKILNKKGVLSVINQLIDKGVIVLKEEIFQQYKPKLIKYVRLNKAFDSERNLSGLLDDLKRAKKQREVILSYFSFQAQTQKPVKLKKLQEISNVSSAVIQDLI